MSDSIDNSEKVIWSGLTFMRSAESHRGYERWDSVMVGPNGKCLWSADRFSREAKWTARLLVNTHRVTGEGQNMHLALDAAWRSAKELLMAISGAMPETLPEKARGQ